MAPLDATLGALRLRIDPTAAHQLRTIRAVTGDPTLSAAIHSVIFDAYMALPSAHSVDAGKPCSVAPERPEGGPGQGTTRPPAPTNVLVPMAQRTGRILCTEGEAVDHYATWWLYPEESLRDGPHFHGAACCDAHIPDGWVRPDEAPAPTIYGHPLVHVHHGTERCVFGEECSR